jgi:hypothetical protein
MRSPLPPTPLYVYGETPPVISDMTTPPVAPMSIAAKKESGADSLNKALKKALNSNNEAAWKKSASDLNDLAYHLHLYFNNPS